MGLFSKKTLALFNPVAGQVVPLEEVHDEVFASQALGEGFGVWPTEGNIYSPLRATVTAIFPTKHAISLTTKNGLEVLVHIGIDTVELKGGGFEIPVAVGDKVQEDTLIAQVDLAYLKTQGKASDVMIIFTNLADRKLVLSYGETMPQKKIGSVD